MYSSKYAAAFASLALLTIAAAVLYGGLAWLLIWPAISLAVVAVAYGGVGPRMFGKRSDGTRAGWATVALAPYLLLQYLLWHAIRTLSRENALDAVSDDVWIGRRMLGPELAHHKIDIVVDLTCEFIEPALVRATRDYRSFPLLDVTAPSAKALLAFLELLPADRTCLIHCAQGHGRTGMVAAALLLVRGMAPTADEAVDIIRQVRPGVVMKPNQKAILQDLERLLDRH